jgi:hypothetical protein
MCVLKHVQNSHQEILKSNDQEQVLVIVNARSSSQSLAVPIELHGNWTNALTNAEVSLSGTLTLTSFQYLILQKW